jgi:hypothetical protein
MPIPTWARTSALGGYVTGHGYERGGSPRSQPPRRSRGHGPAQSLRRRWARAHRAGVTNGKGHGGHGQHGGHGRHGSLGHRAERSGRAEPDDSCDHGAHGDHADDAGSRRSGRDLAIAEAPGGARTPHSDPGSGQQSERNRLRPTGGAPTTPPSHLRPRGRKPTREPGRQGARASERARRGYTRPPNLLPPFRRHSLSSVRRAAVSGRRNRQPAAGAPARSPPRAVPKTARRTEEPRRCRR